MSFWAGIKYALNSTLGTDKFKPLDEIILGTKSLLASDNLYSLINRSYSTQASQTEATLDIPLTILFNWSGSANIMLSGALTSGGNVFTGTITVTIYKNNEIYKTVKISKDDANANLKTPLTFNINDVFSFKLDKPATSGNSTKASLAINGIYADISDGSAITVEGV